jgi:hypothetical protein
MNPVVSAAIPTNVQSQWGLLEQLESTIACSLEIMRLVFFLCLKSKLGGSIWLGEHPTPLTSAS